MDTLESRLPPGWIDDVLTLFADDCWGSWLLHSLSDLRKALSELTILLCTLEDYKMQINYSKTAVLLKFVGKQAKQALHEITVMKNGVRHLRLVVHDVERLIPIKDSHEYLGTKVTYDGPREANLTHRLHCGQRKFQMIQKALTGHHAITQEHRTRLWSACVRTSLHYSLSAAGLNEPDLRRLETRTLKHLRAILRLPAHKTHVSNTEIWQRSQVEPPGPQILQALISFRSKLEARLTTHPDITTRPGIMDYVRSLELQLTAVLAQRASTQDPTPESASPEAWPCQICGIILTSQHALRIHYGPVGQGQAFDPRQHAVGGLPHCRLCGRKFAKWQNLRHHVESGACSALGGVSNPRAEVDIRAEPAAQDQPPSAAVQQGPTELQNAPLIERPFFVRSWQQWDTLLKHSALRTELLHHCSLCQMWVADHQHLKQHIRRAHPHEHAALHHTVVARCKPFRRQLVSNSLCPWCGFKVCAPGRHAEACPVLYQICLAAAYLEQRALASSTLQPDVPQDDDGDGHQLGDQSGCGHLPALPGLADGAVPSTGAHNEGRQGQQAPSPGSGPAAAPAGPTTTLHAFFGRALCADRCRPHFGESRPTTGRPVGRATHGQNVHSVHPGGCHQRAPEPLPGIEGVPPATGGRHPDGPELTQNPPPGMHDEATPGPHQPHALHAGRHPKASNSGLAHGQPGMDAPQVVPTSQTAGDRHRGTPSGTRQPYGIHRFLAGQPQGRRGAEVPLHTEPREDGGGPDPHGHFLPLDQPPGPHRGAGAHTVHQPPGDHSITAHRPLHEAGHAATVATRATGGGTGIRPVGTPGEAAQRTEATPHPHLSNTPPFSLLNDGNACHINALIYTLWLLADQTRRPDMLHTSIRQLTGDRVRAHGVLQYFLLGWPRAREQHDIVEFLDFFAPRVTNSLSGTWQGRQRLAEDAHLQHEVGPLNKCIPLPRPRRHMPRIQDLIGQWHHQDNRCALTCVSEWVFFQLPRFRCTKGRVRKTHQCYDIPNILQVPVFLDEQSTSVVWHSYYACAVIRHHGPSPSSGHYTVMVGGEPGYILDDDAVPRKAEAADMTETSASMYVLALSSIACSMPANHAVAPTRSEVETPRASAEDGSAGHLRDGPAHRAGTPTVRAHLPPGYLSPPTGAGHGRPPGAHGQAGRPYEHDPPSAAGDGDRPGAEQADGNCHPASA